MFSKLMISHIPGIIQYELYLHTYIKYGATIFVCKY